jgi:malate synthase
VDQTGGHVTNGGIRMNVDVGLRYLESWLSGTGAAAIHNLMEDAATAEISRAQLWQWVRNGVHTATGELITAELVRQVIEEELTARRLELGDDAYVASRYEDARRVFEQVALADEFVDFLTLPAYELLP